MFATFVDPKFVNKFMRSCWFLSIALWIFFLFVDKFWGYLTGIRIFFK